MKKTQALILFGLNLLFTLFPCSSFGLGNGKLLATSGTSSIEGSGGGGIVPWAILSGYGARQETTVSVYSTQLELSDFNMQSYGITATHNDRVELSLSRQSIQSNAASSAITMNTVGAKIRLFGDAVYSSYPQLSIGLQHKTLLNTEAANTLGAKRHSGTDIYLSASKIWLDGLFHRNVFLNITLRHTDANQLGLLGFGGDNQHQRWQFESSAGLLLNRHWAIGTEFRMKPDNLSAAKEDDWKNVFVAYFPTKAVTVTVAALVLGDIAGEKNQTGSYLSIQGIF